MFSIIKQAYACSLDPGIKIPSYCKSIQPDCSCIAADGKVISINSWQVDAVKENIFFLFISGLKNPVFLSIFLISLLLAFYTTYFVFKKFLNKKIKGILAIFVKVLIYLIFVGIYLPLLFFLWGNYLYKFISF